MLGGQGELHMKISQKLSISVAQPMPVDEMEFFMAVDLTEETPEITRVHNSVLY